MRNAGLENRERDKRFKRERESQMCIFFGIKDKNEMQ